jgi:hypothetical protein
MTTSAQYHSSQASPDGFPPAYEILPDNTSDFIVQPENPNPHLNLSVTALPRCTTIPQSSRSLRKFLLTESRRTESFVSSFCPSSLIKEMISDY